MSNGLYNALRGYCCSNSAVSARQSQRTDRRGCGGTGSVSPRRQCAASAAASVGRAGCVDSLSHRLICQLHRAIDKHLEIRRLRTPRLYITLGCSLQYNQSEHICRPRARCIILYVAWWLSDGVSDLDRQAEQWKDKNKKVWQNWQKPKKMKTP